MVLLDELRAIVEALGAADVEYALIGALAVAVWGAPRATRDIDLLVRREDLPRAREVGRACGFTLEALPMEFKDGTEMHRLSKVDAAGDLLTLDFMVVDVNLEAAWDSRLRFPFGAGDITVISREALIGLKARAARPQDLMDIQNLQDLDR